MAILPPPPPPTKPPEIPSLSDDTHFSFYIKGANTFPWSVDSNRSLCPNFLAFSTSAFETLKSLMAFSLSTERSCREVERLTENRYKKRDEKKLQETMDRGAGDKGEQETKGYLFKGQQESRGRSLTKGFSGLKRFRDFRKTGPCLRHHRAP